MADKGRKQRPSYEQLEDENRRLRARLFEDRWTRICEALFKYGAYSLIAWQTSRAFIAYSGKASTADLKLDGHLLLEQGTRVTDCQLPLWVWVALIIAAMLCVFCIGLVRGRKDLLGKAINHMSDGKTNLEKVIDPNRTSSGLTKTGETPKDK